jgi:hypothetical protein
LRRAYGGLAVRWYSWCMKIMRTVALAGLAKKAFDEARKPENQARIKAAADKVNQKVAERRAKRQR